MLPSEYAGNYLHLVADLYGEVAEVAIDRYLNAGITGKGVENAKPMDYRANRAIAEKDKLLGKIKQDLKIKGRIPNFFQIDLYAFKLLDVVMPFFGKGSPSNIRDVLWLAAKYKHLSSGTVRDYSTKYLGLDCNGFVGNFWGINPSTPIGSYDKRRRREFADVAAGDAMIFYKNGTTQSPSHIAAVDSIEFLDTTNAKTPTLTFYVTQSGGPDNGVHTSVSTWKLSKSPKGDVIYTGPSRTVYFVQGPERGTPRGLEWTVSDG